ncbi:MAG: YdiU family protein [Gammaproteobacteria bacterium]|nr:YdiU family protein [Gammaproteobacteria bacterium]
MVKPARTSCHWAGGYGNFNKLDGDHPFKEAVPGAFVDYPVRFREGGRVFYFNFSLAREMGLISRAHPDDLTPELTRIVLNTFSLQIINEYDSAHHPELLAQARPRSYMATRYLQLQHPSRKGFTSGDGRSIWNGWMAARGKTWDISSCGTGVTRLSPATGREKKFFRTGDVGASYGSGLADLWDGVAAAMMSEVLHGNGVRTERTLAIIDYGDGSAVNVRAYTNLLRPAHFLHHLKQGNLRLLRQVVDYYIARQVANGEWPAPVSGARAYRYLAQRIAADFGRMAARFESEYIFCWIDWDGDNILMDGGIIDYGSLRQFGLFHHEYRYDDVERMSTSIREQRAKARYVVQTFAQIADYLITGRKKNIKDFRADTAVKSFDAAFASHREELLLYKLGYAPEMHRRLLGDAVFHKDLHEFKRIFSHFERAKSKRGPYDIADGVTWDAVFCMRDVLRELPTRYQAGEHLLDVHEFIRIMRSRYASREDVLVYPARRRRINRFQVLYRRLLERAAMLTGRATGRLLAELVRRSALINRYERITGDAALIASKRLIKSRNTMNKNDIYKLVSGFASDQILSPERRREVPDTLAWDRCARILYQSMIRVVAEYREGL